MTQTPRSRPVRVAVLNDYQLIVAGVAEALAEYADRVEVVEVDVRHPVLSEVDVVLYDTFGQAQGGLLQLDRVTVDSSARVLVFTWNTAAETVEESLSRGASGLLSKGVGAERLVEAIEAVHAGVVVRPDGAEGGDAFGRWPGRREDLSAREAEVLALIARGMTNQEIGEKAFIGTNTVKTHIRHLYRKIGVETRPQAVIWAFSHGFAPESPQRGTGIGEGRS